METLLILHALQLKLMLFISNRKGEKMYLLNSNIYNLATDSKEKKEKEYTKDDDAYKTGNGICYIDEEGNQYTKDDLIAMAGSEAAADYIFEYLKGEHPEKLMDMSWNFIKCKRCGQWIFGINSDILHAKSELCTKCTPLRTNGVIPLEKDPYDDDRTFWKSNKMSLLPGITTLVGCNGIGKTTIIDSIDRFLKSRGTPYLYFNNLGADGGHGIGNTMLGMALSGMSEENGNTVDLGEAVATWSSSEGEKILSALSRFSRKILNSIKAYAGYGEFWILFDAIDSGLSVNIIDMIKENLFNLLLKSVPSDFRLYIVVSSNSWEMSEGTNIFEITSLSYKNIKTYSAFKKSVLKSAQKKAERDTVLKVKYDIWNKHYEYHFDESKCSLNENPNSKCGIEICATMKIEDIEAILYIGTKKNHNKVPFFKVWRVAEDGTKEQIPCKDLVLHDCDFKISNSKAERTMHDWICQRIFERATGRKRRNMDSEE